MVAPALPFYYNRLDMIVTSSKEKKEILKYLDGYKRIFLVGCGDCAAASQTGGIEQVKDMAKYLKDSGKTVTGTLVVDTTCDARLGKRDLAQHKTHLKATDAILVLACGSGVQTISDLVDIPVFPGLDTQFLAKMENLRNFSERCGLCGDCVLAFTAGICPVVRCPKSILNGPCGGVHNGKCEVDPDNDCAWILIYKRLKERGQLDKMKEYYPPKDYSKIIRPRKVTSK
jgi:ferredoxin